MAQRSRSRSGTRKDGWSTAGSQWLTLLTVRVGANGVWRLPAGPAAAALLAPVTARR